MAVDQFQQAGGGQKGMAPVLVLQVVLYMASLPLSVLVVVVILVVVILVVVVVIFALPLSRPGGDK
jgi:hypothetical protein